MGATMPETPVGIAYRGLKWVWLNPSVFARCISGSLAVFRPH